MKVLILCNAIQVSLHGTAKRLWEFMIMVYMRAGFADDSDRSIARLVHWSRRIWFMQRRQVDRHRNPGGKPNYHFCWSLCSNMFQLCTRERADQPQCIILARELIWKYNHSHVQIGFKKPVIFTLREKMATGAWRLMFSINKFLTR